MPRSSSEIHEELINAQENLKSINSYLNNLRKSGQAYGYYYESSLETQEERFAKFLEIEREYKEAIEYEKHQRQEHKKQERKERERKAQERLDRERKELERQERERQEIERQKRERIEQERKEQERIEQEARWRDVEIKNPDIKFLQDFIAKLETFNTTCEGFELKAKEELQGIIRSQKEDMDRTLKEQEKDIQIYVYSKSQAFREYESKLQSLNQQETNRQNTLYAKITQYKRSQSSEEEIKHLREEIFANKESVKRERDKIWKEYQDKCSDILKKRADKWNSNNGERNRLAEKQAKEFKMKIKELEEITQKNINAVIQKFTTEEFNSEEIIKKYVEILADEPIVENYQCKTKNPASIHIASLTHDLSTLNLGKYTKALLESYYHALYRHSKLHIPCCISLKEGFNYLFEVNAKNREFLIDKAKSLAMRLFMMIPPNKVNFTFIDPIISSTTFALFMNLIDVNDLTSKIINEKIWTSATDINERLRVLVDHISNAKQNSEPYQVLMIMDFPGEFSEESLRLLEKIISTGPKCGVYTIIFKNIELVNKIDNKLLPYINNIETDIKRFAAENNKLVMLIEGKEIPFFIKPLLPSTSSLTEIPLFPSETVMDSVIKTLKASFKDASATFLNQ
jgi:hypothetical protein